MKKFSSIIQSIEEPDIHSLWIKPIDENRNNLLLYDNGWEIIGVLERGGFTLSQGKGINISRDIDTGIFTISIANSGISKDEIEDGAITFNKLSEETLSSILESVEENLNIEHPEYDIRRFVEPTDGYLASYGLFKGNVKVGATIDIPKNTSVSSESIKVSDNDTLNSIIKELYIDSNSELTENEVSIIKNINNISFIENRYNNDELTNILFNNGSSNLNFNVYDLYKLDDKKYVYKLVINNSTKYLYVYIDKKSLDEQNYNIVDDEKIRFISSLNGLNIFTLAESPAINTYITHQELNNKKDRNVVLEIYSSEFTEEDINNAEKVIITKPNNYGLSIKLIGNTGNIIKTIESSDQRWFNNIYNNKVFLFATENLNISAISYNKSIIYTDILDIELSVKDILISSDITYTPIINNAYNSLNLVSEIYLPNSDIDTSNIKKIKFSYTQVPQEGVYKAISLIDNNDNVISIASSGMGNYYKQYGKIIDFRVPSPIAEHTYDVVTYGYLLSGMGTKSVVIPKSFVSIFKNLTFFTYIGEYIEKSEQSKLSGSIIDFTDWSNIPINKKLIVGTIDEDVVLQVDEIIPAGEEIYCVIKNIDETDKTIALTQFANRNVDTLTIESEKYAEVSIISDGTNYYVRAIN